ncbi:MAG: hypothetical protein J6C16_02790, partial [Clostridia bacterium]|nr:hypothetical protein [Clostridia bacterium]
MKFTKALKRTISTLIAVLILMGQITYVSAEETNLKIYYNFDDLFQNYVQNQSQHNYAGKLNNVSLTAGLINNSAEFKGADNCYIEIENPSELYPIKAFSTQFWIKTKLEESGIAEIIKISDCFTLSLDKRTGKLSAWTKLAGKEEISVSIPEENLLEKDTWYYIITSYNSGTIRLFLNGKEIVSYTLDYYTTDYLSNNYNNMTIGKNFCGQIDEFKYLSVITTEEQARTNYDNYNGTISMWDSTSFPKTENFTEIETVNNDLFKESVKSFPLNTDYEEKNEVYAIKRNNFNGQKSISEDAYSGKFSLCVSGKDATTYISLKESIEYFIADNKNEQEQILNSSNLQITKEGHTIKGIGYTNANEEIALCVFDNNENIVYINQYTSAENGTYNFEFILPEEGNYTLKTRAQSWDTYIQALIKIDDNTESEQLKIEEYSAKTNIVNVWIKPKYKAKAVSFYVYGEVDGRKKYVKVNSDKDKDGIYELGEDFVQGKWQKIKVDLLDTEETFDYGLASGLYVQVNENSQWLFDKISSDYFVIEENEVDLSLLANDKIIYDTVLKLKEKNNNLYYGSPVQSIMQYDLDKKIAGVQINTDIETMLDNKDVLSNVLTPEITYNVAKYNNSGNKIYYTNTTGLYVYDIITEEKRNIGYSTSNIKIELVSPNGNYIYFKSDSNYYLYNFKEDI